MFMYILFVYAFIYAGLHDRAAARHLRLRRRRRDRGDGPQGGRV